MLVMPDNYLVIATKNKTYDISCLNGICYIYMKNLNSSTAKYFLEIVIA